MLKLPSQHVKKCNILTDEQWHEIQSAWLEEYLVKGTLWEFENCSPMFGLDKFPGRIPGQIVLNLLYRYLNNQREYVVVDPMAGGGTTHDVCKFMNELGWKLKCLCYDINPVRDFIRKHDITTGFPEEAKNCDLIFLDPPYWNMKQPSYGKDSVSSLSLEDFYSFVKKLAKDCYSTVNDSGFVALLMADRQIDLFSENYRIEPLSFNCSEIFLDTDFADVGRLVIPFTKAQYTKEAVEKAKKWKRWLNLTRWLFVFQKASIRFDEFGAGEYLKYVSLPMKNLWLTGERVVFGTKACCCP